MSVPFAPQPGISGIFGRMESAHGHACQHDSQVQMCVSVRNDQRPILFVLSILMLVFYFSYISVSPGLKFPLLVRGEWYIKRDILLF